MTSASPLGTTVPFTFTATDSHTGIRGCDHHGDGERLNDPPVAVNISTDVAMPITDVLRQRSDNGDLISFIVTAPS